MVRAIDVQNTLAKILDVERAQEAGKQQPESAQKQFTREFQEQTQQKLRNVQDIPKAEDAKIRDDEQSGKKHKKQSKKNETTDKAPHPNNREEDLGDEGCGRMIDIKV